MRRLAALAVLLVLCVPSVTFGGNDAEDATETSDAIEAQMDAVEWERLDAVLSALPEETRALWGGAGVRELAALFLPEGETDGDVLDTVRAGLKTAARKELRRMAGTFASLCAVGLIGALIGALTNDEKGGASEAGQFVCRCFALTLILSVFAAAAGTARDCVRQLADGLSVTVPILTTLLTAIGAAGTVGMLHPLSALLTGGIADTIAGVLVPLAAAGGVIGLIDRVDAHIRLKELSDNIRNGIKWGIGLLTAVYAGFAAVFGMGASARDGIAIRTARYAAGNIFPATAGLVGGTFDTVIGSVLLVKNALGITGMLLGVGIALAPLMRIASTIVLFRFTASVTEPVGEAGMVQMLKSAADTLSVLLSLCACCAGMYLITLGVVLGLGGTVSLL